MTNNNPYTDATNAYGKSAAAAPSDQRGLEGHILLKAATKLQALQEMLKKDGASREDIADTLDYNRRLWTVFASNATDDEHDLPQELKNNIASLSVFIFKRTVDVMADPHPDKIQAMIDINRNIAAGLLKKPADENLPAGE